MKRKLLVSLSALILTAALVLTAAILPANVTVLGGGAIGIALGEGQYEFEKAGYKNVLDYIVARDGFIYGADYNIDATLETSSHTLGDNELIGKPAAVNFANIERDFYNIKASGFTCSQWWLMMDLQGVHFDENGLATGIQDIFATNIRKMLDIARKNELTLIPTISNHDLMGNGGYGYAGELAYYKYARFQYDKEAQDAWMENVIDPICEILAEYPDVIAAVAIGVENMTGQVDDYDLGYFQYGTTGTTLEIYGNFYNRLVEVSKRHMPNIPTAIEMGGSYLGTMNDGVMHRFWERLYLQNELDVDFVCQNFYHSGGSAESHSDGFVERPGFLGEYNINEGGVNNNASIEYFTRVQQRVNKMAKLQGLLGAFIHRFSSMDNTTDGSGLSNYEGYRPYVISWRADMQDQKNEFLKQMGREEEIPEYEAPQPYYYLGGSSLYWINGRGADLADIERSEDGGKTWTTVGKNVNVVDSMCSNGLGRFVDTTIEDNKTYRYRITSIWADGTKVTSVETNDALYYVPPELVKDGGFESGKFVADRTQGWQNMGYNKGYEEANFITTENPKTGNYSLKIDTVNNNHSGYASVWQTFPGTDPGKNYRVEYSRYVVQGTYEPKEAYNEPATCVLTKKSGGTISAQFFSGGANNGKWVDGAIEVSVGPETDIGVKFMSGTGNHKIIFYIDDVSCKEVK